TPLSRKRWPKAGRISSRTCGHDGGSMLQSLDLRLLPCHRQTKGPLIANGVYGATSDPELQEKWAAKWPDALWGIVCGIAFDVLDVDPDGLEWAREHLCDWETYVQRTPRGLHYYSLTTPGLKSRVGCPVAGIDVRAANSYVIDWR